MPNKKFFDWLVDDFTPRKIKLYMKDILIPVWVQIIPHVFAVEHTGFE